MLTQTQKDQILSILDGDFDFVSVSDVEQWINDNDDIAEKLQDIVSQQEIIYYDKAMKYLIEHDASLTESFELVADYGYTLLDLNSEKLATIHNQDRLNGLLHDIAEQLEQFKDDEED